MSGGSSEREQADRELDALVEAALGGDQDAFARIVELKRTLVFRTAYQQLGSVDEARLVTQSVFIQVWKKLGSFDRSRRFDTWLYQVTVNAAIDHHRRRAVRFRETPFDEAFRAAPLDDDDSAERRLELREVQRILSELAAELTDKQRAAFVLREIEGLPTAEVAEALGTSESTVRNHVFQARRILRERLRERYPEYAPRPAGNGSESSEPSESST